VLEKNSFQPLNRSFLNNRSDWETNSRACCSLASLTVFEYFHFIAFANQERRIAAVKPLTITEFCLPFSGVENQNTQPNAANVWSGQSRPFAEIRPTSAFRPIASLLLRSAAPKRLTCAAAIRRRT
jgi:hypothetical protein